MPCAPGDFPMLLWNVFNVFNDKVAKVVDANQFRMN